MLGAHSFDQVLYGWTYGLWFAFFLFRYFRPLLQVHIRRMLEINGANSEFSIHDRAAMTKRSLWHIIFALLFWIAVIAISSIIYYQTAYHFTYPDSWIMKIIQCKGGVEDGLSPNKMFTNSAFISTGGASSIFGAYFGILLDSLYLNGSPHTINATDKPLLRGVARLLISLLCVCPFALPFLLISDSDPMMIVYLFK
jgi:hypothetical protein